ncbi:MAG TPA: hypothetical protein VK764_05890 [Terracidiphilus sp.]|jgi:hypothetical protein|nr:hypothetical protein [Terracidiphilus sp.]
MRRTAIVLVFLGGILGVSAGCHTNTVDKEAFKTAINSYYSGRQDCVWPTPVKFPAQADTKDDLQTRGYDALTDAGLLTRKSAEKSRFLIGSKQVNDYDLSDKGRSTWVADQAQPGYGNFCFGHLSVSSIDNYTPADPNAVQYSVTYHYSLGGAPDWATSAEMKSAFPKIASDSSGQRVATANLTKSDNGWQVVSVQPSSDSGS